MAEPLRIALAGLGTVGAGLVRLVETNGSLIEGRAGRPLRIVAVSARDRTKDRSVDIGRANGWILDRFWHPQFVSRSPTSGQDDLP